MYFGLNPPNLCTLGLIVSPQRIFTHGDRKRRTLGCLFGAVDACFGSTARFCRTSDGGLSSEFAKWLFCGNEKTYALQSDTVRFG